MRTQEHFYNSMLYKVEYQPELSQSYYTQRHVYHIRTEEERYPEAHKAIQAIMNDGSWTVLILILLEVSLKGQY